MHWAPLLICLPLSAQDPARHAVRHQHRIHGVILLRLAMQVLVLAATLLAAASLSLLRNPSAAAALLPGMLALWGGSFPVAYIVQAASGLPALPASAQELFPDAGIQLEDERWAANRCACPRAQVMALSSLAGPSV